MAHAEPLESSEIFYCINCDMWKLRGLMLHTLSTAASFMITVIQFCQRDEGNYFGTIVKGL